MFCHVMNFQADGLASRMSKCFAMSIEKVIEYLSLVAMSRPDRTDRVSYACRFFGWNLQQVEGKYLATLSICCIGVTLWDSFYRDDWVRLGELLGKYVIALR